MARILLAAWVTLVSGCRPAPEAAPVRVAAAAGVRDAMEEVLAEYRAANPGARVEASYLSSGAAAAQIEQGAPFDLFYAADERFPRALEERGIVPPGSSKPYARGRLALWIPSRIGLAPSDLSILSDPRIRKIAIANPETAPYGRAADEAIRTVGLDSIRGKLVFAQDVGQVAQMALAAADAAFVPLGAVVAGPLTGKGTHLAVPEALYGPLLHCGVIVHDRPETRAFDAFLRGDAGARILRARGFEAP